MLGSGDRGVPGHPSSCLGLLQALVDISWDTEAVREPELVCGEGGDKEISTEATTF